MRPEFVRCVISEIDPSLRQPTGVFHAAWRLRKSGALGTQERSELDTHLDWLKSNLPEPDRFVLTRSKGFYRRQPVGISWFKAEAIEFIAHAQALARIVATHGVPVQRLRTTHPGYVVYEDAHQVVALPFQDR